MAIGFVRQLGLAVVAALSFATPSAAQSTSFPTADYDTGTHDGISRRGALEMAAVGLTGAGHLAFSELDRSAWFIPVATLGWGGYVYHRARTERDFLQSAGFTASGLGPAFRDATIFAAASAGVMAGIAVWQDAEMFEREMIPLLVLYPAWGLLQQFLVQAMVSDNLTNASGWIGSPYAVTPISATLFGAVHVPSWKLAAATFVMGLVFTPLYLRHENLWPLGLYHGWLGVLFYQWVLERNPLKRMLQ